MLPHARQGYEPEVQESHGRTYMNMYRFFLLVFRAPPRNDIWQHGK